MCVVTRCFTLGNPLLAGVLPVSSSNWFTDVCFFYNLLLDLDVVTVISTNLIKVTDMFFIATKEV